MLFVSNRFDVWLFNKIKRRFGGRMLWLRNNVSTIICNCLENYFFMFLAFYRNPVISMTIQEIFIVGSTTSLIEALIASKINSSNVLLRIFYIPRSNYDIVLY
jgi:uncharacterized integral membrane protein (TIGR00697 family)